MFAKFRHMISLVGLTALIFFILSCVSFGENVKSTPRTGKAPKGSLKREFKALVSEMKNEGHDVSEAEELDRQAGKAMKEGRRKEARALRNKAILSLRNIKSKDEGAQSGAGHESPKILPASMPKSQTIKIDIGVEKVRVIDTFPFDVNTVSNNTLQNFRYYELNTEKGAVTLNISHPVILQEYPYSAFEFKNNKAFGATESGQGNYALKHMSDRELDSRQGKIFNILSQAGIGLARDFKSYDTRRAFIESQKGVYSFSHSDYAVNAAIDKRIDFIGRITPHRDRETVGLPEDEPAYIAYIKQTVGRYKGRVKYWQTLKEPAPRTGVKGNDAGLSPKDAVRILELSYTAIKSVDKESMVYFPGLGPPFEFGGYNEDSYFEKIISLGGAKYFDVLGCEAYVHDIVEQAEKYRKILKKYGYDKPLWVAQTGVPDVVVPQHKKFRGGGSTMAQCEFMVKEYARAFAIGIEKVFWGEFLDESRAEGKNRAKHSILWDRTGLFHTGSWEKKPAYFMHRLLASVLYDFTKAEKVAPNIVKFTFANRSTVYLVWPN